MRSRRRGKGERIAYRQCNGLRRAGRSGAHALCEEAGDGAEDEAGRHDLDIRMAEAVGMGHGGYQEGKTLDHEMGLRVYPDAGAVHGAECGSYKDSDYRFVHRLTT